MIPAHKLSWIAAIIDLKGKIVRKNNKMRATPQLVLVVDSKDMRIIRELSSHTGTAPELKTPVAPKDWMRRGCTEHCPDAHIHVNEEGNGRPVWPGMPTTARWSITGAGAAIVLSNILPYTICDNGLEGFILEIFDNTPLDGRGSHATIAQIRRLAELGWDIPEAFVDVLKIETVIEQFIEKEAELSESE